MEERCEAGSVTCPSEQLEAYGVQCRVGQGPCPPETCDGVSAQCGTSCRATETPESWLDLCGTGSLPHELLSLCALLAGLDLADATDAAVAEGLVLAMNVVASSTGVLPPGFGALHFAHGRYAGYTVADVHTGLDPWSLPANPELLELAIAANRAFVGGHDSGALAEWVTTPVCSAPGTPPGDTFDVEGPASARCGMLDGPCARGRYLAAGGCCTVELQPAGTLCGAEQVCTQDASTGRCNGSTSWATETRSSGAWSTRT